MNVNHKYLILSYLTQHSLKLFIFVCIQFCKNLRGGFSNNQKICIFIDIFLLIICEQVKFAKTKSQPIIPLQTFTTHNKFKLFCQHFIEFYDNKWMNDKDISKTKAKQCVNLFIKSLNKIKKNILSSSKQYKFFRIKYVIKDYPNNNKFDHSSSYYNNITQEPVQTSRKEPREIIQTETQSCIINNDDVLQHNNNNKYSIKSVSNGSLINVFEKESKNNDYHSTIHIDKLLIVPDYTNNKILGYEFKHLNNDQNPLIIKEYVLFSQ